MFAIEVIFLSNTSKEQLQNKNGKQFSPVRMENFSAPTLRAALSIISLLLNADFKSLKPPSL
jgi:outer membrane phospholipase A